MRCSPLNTTSNEAPMSAAIVLHSDAVPTNVNTTKHSFTITAAAMFYTMLRSVHLECAISHGTRQRSFEMSAMSAVSLRHRSLLPPRHSEGGPGHGWGVVRAVAHHGDVSILRDQLVDRAHFVFG